MSILFFFQGGIGGVEQDVSLTAFIAIALNRSLPFLDQETESVVNSTVYAVSVNITVYVVSVYAGGSYRKSSNTAFFHVICNI